MTYHLRVAVGSLALALAAACTGDTQAVAPAGGSQPAVAPNAGSGGGGGGGGGDVVATAGSRSITRAEVEQEVRSELIAVDNQRYEVLKNGLDQMIATELVSQEAAARGMTLGALLQAEVVDKVGEPSDEEVEQLYEQAKEQLQGRPLEEVRPQLVQYLAQQGQGARQSAFIDELKAKYPTRIALRPPVIEVATAGGPEKGGGADAPVTIIAFSDYECPFCKRGEDVIDQVMAEYGDKVRLVFRDYPLPFHANARPAAEAANCAAAQGKFWDYHVKLFENQQALGGEDLKRYASEVGLDTAAFDTCISQRTYKDAVQQDLDDGAAVGVDGTPAFFINGRMLSGAQPFEKFKEVIDDELSAGT